MDASLYKFDVYPMVIKAHETSEITIKPIDFSESFDKDKEYQIRIMPTDEGSSWAYPDRWNKNFVYTKPCDDGAIRFTFKFGDEQLYFIRIKENDDDVKAYKQFNVYAVDKDLQGRYPFIGDLHMHTRRSDGREAPAVVAANYRKLGYDFLSITDHRRYYPSLEAIDAYKDVPLEYTLIVGEEIHLPSISGKTDPHIVNFGGEFSVNALIRENDHCQEVGEDLSLRAIRENDVPDVMSVEEFDALMLEKAKEYPDAPYPSESYTYASMKFSFDMIKKGNGLSIFAHPYWFSECRQVPESFTEYVMEKQDFDAFEVLGGEVYFEQNGFQIIRYYEDLAKGRDYPIVGSTDSHSSLPTHRGHDVARTMVFAHENERLDLIASIKDKYTAALDMISKEPRYVGSQRLVRYACFLWNNFFPLHDELCFEEGRAMREYATGNKEDAKKYLVAINGRMKKQREKYFNI